MLKIEMSVYDSETEIVQLKTSATAYNNSDSENGVGSVHSTNDRFVQSLVDYKIGVRHVFGTDQMYAIDYVNQTNVLKDSAVLDNDTFTGMFNQ